MPTCSIIQCGARKNLNQPHLTMHRFPKNEVLRYKWLEVIGMENIKPGLKVLLVCSVHFAESCSTVNPPCSDPDDRSLRRVEKDVMIPKLIREKAKKEKCTKEVADFENCCKESSLLMVVKCRNQNSALKDCLGDWYKNEEFKKQCTEEYLAQRSEYRRTGIRKPIKRA